MTKFEEYQTRAQRFKRKHSELAICRNVGTDEMARIMMEIDFVFNAINPKRGVKRNAR